MAMAGTINKPQDLANILKDGITYGIEPSTDKIEFQLNNGNSKAEIFLKKVQREEVHTFN